MVVQLNLLTDYMPRWFARPQWSPIKVLTRQCTIRSRTLQPVDHKSDALHYTTEPRRWWWW